MNVKNKLEKEIATLLDAMGEMEVGTEEYNKAANDVTKLMDKYNEMNKNDYDYWDRQETREKDHELKEKQMEEDRKDRRIKNWLAAISVGSGIVLPIVGTAFTMYYEDKGVLPSNKAAQEFVKKLFHFK